MGGFADQRVPHYISEELERKLAELGEKHEKVLAILAEVLDDWRAGGVRVKLRATSVHLT
jgi:hypothetical protein